MGAGLFPNILGAALFVLLLVAVALSQQNASSRRGRIQGARDAVHAEFRGDGPSRGSNRLALVVTNLDESPVNEVQVELRSAGHAPQLQWIGRLEGGSSHELEVAVPRGGRMIVDVRFVDRQGRRWRRRENGRCYLEVPGVGSPGDDHPAPSRKADSA